jgi:hypothetical protein
VIFVVTREETTLTYTGPTKIANGQPFTFTALLREDGVVPIAGREVVITLGSGATAQTCTPTPVTDASGVASCTITPAQPLNGAATVPIKAVFAGDPFYLPSSTSATLRLQYMTGRAFGASAKLNVSGIVGTLNPTPNTPQVRTAVASTTSTPCTASAAALGMVSGQILCANVTTEVNPGRSTATATVARAIIKIPGAPQITATAVKAVSETTCAGSTGTTTFIKLTIDGSPVDVSNVQPNTTIRIGSTTIILNQQVRTPGQLTVNALHVIVKSPQVNADVIVASATSDIHNCI